jgi:hypothetical protein
MPIRRGEFYTPKFKEIKNEFFDLFNQQAVHEEPQDFEGSGIYALYYVGDYPLYEELVNYNKQHLAYPVYVGKTSPSYHKTQVDYALQYRIKKHYESVGYVDNLDVADLRHRYLIVHPSMRDLIPALESVLIGKYHPVWNTIMKGFGSTNPSAGRKLHTKSVWDIIHTGRPYAEGRPMKKSMNLPEVERKIVQHITRYLPK